jgi:hypothetical protein
MRNLLANKLVQRDRVAGVQLFSSLSALTASRRERTICGADERCRRVCVSGRNPS